MTHCVLQRIVGEQSFSMLNSLQEKQANKSQKEKKKLQHSDNETIIQFKIIEKHHPQGSLFFFFSHPINILQSISLLSFPLVILRATDDSAANQNQNTSVFYTVYQKIQFKKCIALCLELLLTLLRPSNSIFFLSVIHRSLQCLQIL